MVHNLFDTLLKIYENIIINETPVSLIIHNGLTRFENLEYDNAAADLYELIKDDDCVNLLPSDLINALYIEEIIMANVLGMYNHFDNIKRSGYCNSMGCQFYFPFSLYQLLDQGCRTWGK